MTAAKDPRPAPDGKSPALVGQAAVVTGASGGIGRAIAFKLASAGAAVVVHGHSHPKHAEQTLREVRSLGVDAVLQFADLADSAQQDALVARAWDWRPIDCWVNCAGVDVLTGPAAGWTFEKKLAALWAVDVAATIRVSRDVGRRMQQRGRGVILNIGWDRAACGMAGDSGEMFAAVKAAVAAFSQSLARSLAPNVRVNCLAPGWIKTTWGESASDLWQRHAAGDALLEQWGTPEDVASMALFLASPAAGFINGQVIQINGGLRHP